MFNYEFRVAVWLVKVLDKVLSTGDLLPTFKKIIVNFRDVLDGYSKSIDHSFASSLTEMSEEEIFQPIVSLEPGDKYIGQYPPDIIGKINTKERK